MNNWKLRHSFTGNATSDVQTVNGYLADPAYHLTTNLLLQSNQFDTTWVNIRSNDSSGEIGYDGSNNAWKFSDSIDTGTHRLDQPDLAIAENSVYTFSIYAKEGEHNTLGVEIGNLGVAGNYVLFNLSDGTTSETGSIINSSMTAVGNGWYRCSMTSLAGYADRLCMQVQTGSTASYTGNGTDGIYIQDAQLEEGTQATTYVETTTEPVTLPDTFNVTVVPDGKEYAAPLFIPRTNLVPNSVDPIQKGAVTTTENYGIAPDGSQSSLKIQKDGASANDRVRYIDDGAIVSGQTYTISAFVKNIDIAVGGVTTIASRNNGGTLFRQGYEWNGASLSITSFAEGGTRSNVLLEDYGNGWWRIGFTYVADATDHDFELDIDRQNGSATTSLEAWGAQFEQGDTATEYIPTNGSAVTRDWSAFGRVQNQLPGICNGTHTHTGAASGSGIAATTITGSGSGATFAYDFDTLGVLTTLTADGAGSGYKVGDKLSIDTTEGHTIEFRLVEGSNAATVSVSMGATRPNKPIPFPVSKMRVEGLTDRTVLFMDERSRYVFPKPTPYLLDTYEGAAAAYSLRRLRSAYTGPAVRVRRASNNDELDIYFNRDGSLDTATLEAFCAGTDGFVKVWYDQGQGGNDATQGATGAQPKIYDSDDGVVEENELPALEFDGSNSYMAAADVATTQPTTFSFVATTDTSSVYFFDGDEATDRQAAFNSGGYYSAFAGVTQGSGLSYVEGLQVNVFGLFNGTAGALYANAAGSEPKNMGTNTLSGLIIGQRYNDTQLMDGRFQELIFWNADHSGNRTTIQTNVNDFYSIYP